METVTIQEASRRLNVSQREIREYIRKGELKAVRDTASESGRWLVELPEEGWQDRFKLYLNDLSADHPSGGGPSRPNEAGFITSTTLASKRSCQIFSAGSAGRTSTLPWTTTLPTAARTAYASPPSKATRSDSPQSTKRAQSFLFFLGVLRAL